MRKLTIIIILSILIAVLIPCFPSASGNYSPIDIIRQTIIQEYGLVEVDTDSTLKYDGKLYIPVKKLFDRIGCSTKWDAAKSEVAAEWNGFTLRAKPNSRIFTLNGRVFTCDAKMISKSGTAYIPLEFLIKNLGLSAVEKAGTGTVSISGIPDVSGFGTLDDIFPASPVTGRITKKASLYSAARGKIKGTVPSQTIVEVLADKNYTWYNIKTQKGDTGWVSKNDILIDQAYKVNTDIPSKEEIETYMDLKKFDSRTGYIVWVDISRQLVYVLIKDGSSFRLYKTMKCSTGSNKSPTTRGTFTVKKDRGYWFYSSAAHSGAKYWVRFNGLYLFHSIAMDSKQRIQDPTLGRRVSSGCVRLSLADSSWVYRNLKEGTVVYVN